MSTSQKRPDNYCLDCGTRIGRHGERCNGCASLRKLTQHAQGACVVDTAKHRKEMDAKAWAYAVIKRANKYNRFKGATV